ncbi:MAG: hypothetical protein ACO1Q7_00725 [Gemmatimonas sp.]
MYATCTFCHATLGRNESIEAFPVGKRLAFDSAKGRLWAVCPHCAQWNLSPIEERWEAIETAESLFRSTKLRHSTSNIGLARMRDGTDLIRIGSPLRPEMAAWRYGSNFVRRWGKAAAWMGAGSAAVATSALLLPLPVFASTIGATGATLAIGAQMIRMGGKVAFVGRVILDNEQQYLRVSPKELHGLRLVAHESGWALSVPYQARGPRLADANARTIYTHVGSVQVHGRSGETALRQLLPLINGFGARRGTVNDAVSLAGSWTESSSAFAHALRTAREIAPHQQFTDPGSISALPPAIRLALEMSLHEDEERRALDGELDELRRAWEVADEVAAISDSLLVPGPITQTLNRLKLRK